MVTPEEIDAIKYAVKPLTPEERAELRATQARIEAIASGELDVEAEAEEPTAGIPQAALETMARQSGIPISDLTSIPQDALKARAIQLGVPVSDLTAAQIEEVRASLPAEEPRTRGGRRRVSEPVAEIKPEPVAEPEPET